MGRAGPAGGGRISRSFVLVDVGGPACEGDTTSDPSSLAPLEGGAPAVRSRGASCVWRAAATQLVTSERISALTAELSDDSDAEGDW